MLFPLNLFVNQPLYPPRAAKLQVSQALRLCQADHGGLCGLGRWAAGFSFLEVPGWFTHNLAPSKM